MTSYFTSANSQVLFKCFSQLQKKNFPPLPHEFCQVKSSGIGMALLNVTLPSYVWAPHRFHSYYLCKANKPMRTRKEMDSTYRTVSYSLKAKCLLFMNCEAERIDLTLGLQDWQLETFFPHPHILVGKPPLDITEFALVAHKAFFQMIPAQCHSNVFI